MSSPATKRQRTTASSSSPAPNDPPYELYYWPTIPGRGEPIRLCFEATSTPYTDVCNSSPSTGMPHLRATISPTALGPGANPPAFAPPILQHGSLTLSQLPNILLYLGPRLGLVPPESEDPHGVYAVNQLALTALDGFSNEAHDTHHPVGLMAYYGEQKEEAKRKARDYVATRVPKFLGYFERALQSEASRGGEFLYGGRLTYADLVLWQTLDGVTYAFPKAMARLRATGEYEGVFGLYERVKGRKEVKEYLESERRQKYGEGIWRHYPELDDE
ncbi:MAG: hypothetical protein LQ342_008282 [Letrouitia transgressa]|nr:MAG: hypothetical protein LQ342_008282 [Letrouitia transgressa]